MGRFNDFVLRRDRPYHPAGHPFRRKDMGRIHRPTLPVPAAPRIQNGCRTIAIAGVFLATLMFIPAISEAQPRKPTEWLVNFDRAMAEARKQDRIVLAYFSVSDCEPWGHN